VVICALEIELACKSIQIFKIRQFWYDSLGADDQV